MAIRRCIVLLFLSFVLLTPTFLVPSVPTYAQEWGDFSADVDGDGLPNVVEQEGWYNDAGGPYYTNPQDADADDDGLMDGEEKLYGTDPFSDRSPGLYVKYQDRLQTREYFGWQRFGNSYIVLPYPSSRDAVVVRRGTTFHVGGPADASIEIEKSISGLTTLTPERDRCAGGWQVHVPSRGTVGMYTIIAEDGAWSESLNLYVIFELPSGRSDDFISAYIYTESPQNRRASNGDSRADVSVLYAEGIDNGTPPREYTHRHYAWIPEGTWVNHGYVWAFRNQHYQRWLVKDHVMPYINGRTSQWSAANALGNHIDHVTCLDWPRVLYNSWQVLHPLSYPPYNAMNQCSNVAAALAAFHRAAGIPSRPVFTDWKHGTFDHSTEVWLGAWYVMRGARDERGLCATDPTVSRGYRRLSNPRGWYHGQGVYAAGEDWPWGGLGGFNVSGDKFRQNSWNSRVIVKKHWWETRFRAYWGTSSEPRVIGTPPGDWPRSTLASPSASEVGALELDAPGPSVNDPDEVIQFGQLVDDYGVDLDGDGRFDELVLEVEVEARQAGDYWILGALAGEFAYALEEVHLEEGGNTVALRFDGDSVYMSKADGPYVLAGLWATEGENPGPAEFADNELGYARPAHRTSAYAFGDFGVAGATLLEDYGYRAVDTDDDGYADALVVETGLNIERAGNYTVRGALQDGQGGPLGEATWTGSGSTVTLQFDGLRDTVGPYSLYLHVRDADGQVTDGIIEPYDLGELPELSAKAITLGVEAVTPPNPSLLAPTFVITDGYSDSPVDTDGDGQFDRLVVTVNVEVEAGEGGQAYRVEGWLLDENDSLISYAIGDSEVLTEGMQSLTLAFDGRVIHEHGVDGRYTVASVRALAGDTYSVLDEVDVAYTTPSYDHDDFEDPMAVPMAGDVFEDRMETKMDYVVTESFEASALGAAWTTSSSTPEGRIRLTDSHSTAGGTGALLMDTAVEGDYTLNEAIWTVDLSGVEDASLTFWHAEWGDEQHGFGGDFVGSYNADGIAISDDGVNWHPVFDAPNQNDGVWQQYTIDLTAEAAAVGVTLGPGFRIKFQQYDDYPLDDDGRGWEEIVIVKSHEKYLWTAGFETGALDAAWTTSSSTGDGRIQVTDSFGAALGTYALLMDDVSEGGYTLNEAVWTVDLSGLTAASLVFWHADWDDEQHGFGGDFVGSYNADGVAISDDGTNWHPVFDTPNQVDGTWQQYTVDLAAEAAAAGMTLGPDFKIKFQQYDNYPLDGDGRGWDQIVVVVADGLWMPESPWSLTDRVWHSCSHAWEANASGSQNGSLTSIPIDVSNRADPILRLRTCYAMQSPGDVGYLEVSTDDGVGWTRVVTYTGATSHWSTEFVDLGDFDAVPSMQLRFNASSQDGLRWYVDDLWIIGWLDADGDGLSNEDESDVGTDPNNPDTDGDGLIDSREVEDEGTDPLDPDSDDDGIPDGWEVDNGLDPLKDDANEDPDDDGLTNSEEYQNDTDPLDGDSDDDGLNDGDEVNTHGTDPNDADSDDDGLTDGDEVNTHGTDPNDADCDDDGLTDGEEVNTHGTDPHNPDMDGDGLTDREEVEDHGTDPDDPDSDDDSIPDGWEVDNGLDPLKDDAGEDPDDDGLTNLEEYQNDTDPLDGDSDDDGLTDGDEVNTHDTDPNDADSDDDGLTDGDELNTHGTDPNDADCDDDGMSDGCEVNHGLDPWDDSDADDDPDGDGLTNREECELGTDPHNGDTDGDDVPDGVDPHPTIYDYFNYMPQLFG